MSNIQLKRGQKQNLPANALSGEPLVTLDTKELFIGDLAGDVSPVQIVSDNIIDKGSNDGVAELDSSGFIPRYIKTSELYFSSVGVITVNFNQNKLLISLPTSEYRLLKCLINVLDQDTGEFYSSELIAHHNGSVANFTEYASIGEETVSITVSVEESNINVYGFGSKDNQIVRIITTAIRFN